MNLETMLSIMAFDYKRNLCDFSPFVELNYVIHQNDNIFT